MSTFKIYGFCLLAIPCVIFHTLARFRPSQVKDLLQNILLEELGGKSYREIGEKGTSIADTIREKLTGQCLIIFLARGVTSKAAYLHTRGDDKVRSGCISCLTCTC